MWDKILVAKNSEVRTFYAVDTIYSYFQDRDLFPTTHYELHYELREGNRLLKIRRLGVGTDTKYSVAPD